MSVHVKWLVGNFELLHSAGENHSFIEREKIIREYGKASTAEIEDTFFLRKVIGCRQPPLQA